MISVIRFSEAKAGWPHTLPQVALFLSRWSFSLGLPAWQPLPADMWVEILQQTSGRQTQPCLMFPFWSTSHPVKGMAGRGCLWLRQEIEPSHYQIIENRRPQRLRFNPDQMVILFSHPSGCHCLAPCPIALSPHPEGSGSEFLQKHLQTSGT